MRVKNPLRTAYNLVVHKAPLEAQLIVTRRCNLSCGYCTEYDEVSPYIELAVLKERVDALHRLRVVNVSMLGGEPLMHPQLPEIVEYTNRGSQVSVTTNSFLLNEGLIGKLNEAGLQNMEVSVDALTPDPTRYIQKTLRSIKSKLELLKKHARFDVHVNLVLCDQTKQFFRQTLKELECFDVRVAIDLYHDPKGMVDIRGDEYVQIWDDHYKRGRPFTVIDYEYGKSILSGQHPKWKCRAGARMLYVDEFGKVQYCSAQRGRLAVPVTKYTKRHLREQSRKYKGCEAGCSILCGFRDSIIDNDPIHAVRSIYRGLREGVVSVS
jgi:MoaA/NifB/PqqE/SkfB family radical SAM enzyme